MDENNRVAQIARWHVTFGLGFAVIGMALGIYMAVSQNHAEHPTHAHILLLGFVVSVLYGVVYKLWLAGTSARMAALQTVLHELGATVLAVALFLLFGGQATEATLGPILGFGSICALLGAVLMLYQVLRISQPLAASTPQPMAVEKL